MKLSRHAFVRFWEMHAWIGVAGGIVLHVMFFAGAFALFHAELGDWQERPATPAATSDRGGRPSLGAAVDRMLRDKGAEPDQINVWLAAGQGRFVEVSWRDKSAAERVEIRVDAVTGSVVAATSHLNTILYWLHFLYHPKATWGMYVAGVLGVALLVALVTGVLIHLKDLAKQFHQFRPKKTTRILWSDMHKVLGVMGLPFQVMYAFTGALLCFISLALTLFAGPVFGGDRNAAQASLWGEHKMHGVERRGTLGLDALLEKARLAVPGFHPEYVRIDGLADRAATVSFWGRLSGRLFRRGDVVLRASDGALLADSASSFPTPGAAVSRWVTGLHYAWFGGLAAKVLYALLTAAGCLTILSGNWIWLARREARAQSTGNRLLAKLTIGVGGGVIVATAALFWANRLAPASYRMAAESWAFFGGWALCALLFLFRAEAGGGWVGLLRLSGAAFALVPIAGLVGHAGRPAGADGASALPGVEVGLVIVGALLWSIAAIVRVRVRASAGPGVTAPTAPLASSEAAEGKP
jgi:uncharacterized iron-regulated membrane protein